MTATATATATVLAALIRSLSAASAYNKDDAVAPCAVLWTDKDRQWEALVPSLLAVLPHLLVLGPHDPAARSGPAIWMRCMIARRLPEANWQMRETPILYLPGVSRQDLRAVEECPKELQPLAELQFRGAFWTQVNAKDWTVGAFLKSKEGGLGLDVAQDAATAEAMKQALVELAGEPVKDLQDRRLEASDFIGIVMGDMPKQLLDWMNDPGATKSGWGDSKWQTFRSACKQQYGFDPQTDGDLVAGEMLGQRTGAWSAVWARFADAPRKYPNLPTLLRRSTPDATKGLFITRSSFPTFNQEMEDHVRKSLSGLANTAAEQAAVKVAALEAENGERRGWVWAELGDAPLARALGHLAVLASVAQKPLGGGTPNAMAVAYAAGAWRADAAVLDTLACVASAEDVAAVRTAVMALYRPWLEASAERFQELVRGSPLPTKADHNVPPEQQGSTCILFADGLRFDLAQRLKATMNDRGWEIEDGWSWSALPSVTPTAKPAVAPVAHLIDGENVGEEFRPCIAATRKPLDTQPFRQLLQEQGWQVLKFREVGDPSGHAWTEYGSIDSTGHAEGWKLAWRVEEQLRGLLERINELLTAGWASVRVVTDHGWLLLPGGLPKVEMPAYLAETRWGRCAVLKQKSKTDLPTVAWHWSNHVRVAIAPGIGCFKAGIEYAHGGVSLQECMVPKFVVRSKASAVAASISGLKWTGLRCRVTVSDRHGGLTADIRTKAADATSSIAAPKAVGDDGTASLLVTNATLEGNAALVVLLGADGKPVAKLATTVGGKD